MRTLHRVCLAITFSLSSFIFAQQDKAPVSPGAVPSSEPIVHRNPTGSAVELEGLIRLDVTVTDQAGRPVAGLGRDDFTLLDNGRPEEIVAFRPVSTQHDQPDTAIPVLLLLDTLDLSFNLANFEREQVVKFLLQNEGHLAQPVTIYSLENSRFFLLAGPSRDGNALSKAVEYDKSKNGLLFVPPSNSPVVAGLRAIGTIAAAETLKPGRKLLLWVGPGVSHPSDSGTGQYPGGVFDYREDEATTVSDPISGVTRSLVAARTSPKERDEIFGKIYWLSTLLRHAHVSIDTFSVGEDNETPALAQIHAEQTAATELPSGQFLYTDLWRRFLADAPSAQQANIMDVYKKVLTIQSGGLVLPSERDLAQQMTRCIADADVYYTLTFDPPPTAQTREYHALKVKLSQARLTARTTRAYYDQPFYSDPPDPTLRNVTVAQLEEMVQAAHGSGDAERQLSTVKLTERLSGAKLADLTAELHGGKAREALKGIADESAFLAPPLSEIPADPPPDAGGQQQILSAAADYLSKTIAKLPNFFATRKTISLGQSADSRSLSTEVDPMPLHVEEISKGTVLYRHGMEIVDASPPPKSTEDRLLSTYGTFGPVLSAMQAAIALPGGMTWSRWEQAAGGRIAIFHYVVPMNKSMIDVKGCCLPDGDGENHFQILPAYHGEIAIDPVSGTIFRLQVQTDLKGFVPVNRSDIMVSYGPVEIGGRTYILPLRSVSIWRGRVEPRLGEWNISFQTWGPYETRMNDFAFDQYHIFRGESHILPGFKRIP
jgi:VWFA-related protein